jgi:hypothetical protein
LSSFGPVTDYLCPPVRCRVCHAIAPPAASCVIFSFVTSNFYQANLNLFKVM